MQVKVLFPARTAARTAARAAARTAAMVVMLVLTCAAAQAQQRVAEEGSTNGSITGKVVNESGQPLPNANVYVQAGEARGTEPVITDREGAFKVSGLKTGSYLVNATMPSYTSAFPNTEMKQYKVGDSVTLVLVKGAVITGTVTTATGDPVIAIPVRARMIRDAKGQRSPEGIFRVGATDDRGVYRIYGLPTGIYVVVAGGNSEYGFSGGAVFDTNIPTYAPSSTRDTAAEINVRAGDETTNIDIRYRGEPGSVISGVARSVRADETRGAAVTLTSVGADGSQSSMTYPQQTQRAGFVFFGVADGDYSLTARNHREDGEMELSDSIPIKVRGADIEGIDLIVKPLASISGRVVLEDSKVTECVGKDRPVFSETFISAWHRQTEAAKTQSQFVWSLGAPASADAQGNVTLRRLAPSQYYFMARLAAKSWYVQSISFAQETSKRTVDATRVWTTVKSGDRLSGLTVTLAQGAASLNGQLALSEGEAVPEKLFVYLVPAEKEKADEVLRFYAASVSPEGKMALNNLAPGRYWILAKPALEGMASPVTKLRTPDDVETRAGLRREAEAAKNEIEFKPCQIVVDYRLKLSGQ